MKEVLIYRKPQLLFLFTALFVFLLSLIRPNSSIDIKMHDTYLVIYLWHYGVSISIICLILHFIYDITLKLEINKFIKLSYSIITSAYILIFSLYHIFFSFFIKISFIQFNKFMAVILLLFFVVQIIFFITIIYKLFHKVLKWKD